MRAWRSSQTESNPSIRIQTRNYFNGKRSRYHFAKANGEYIASPALSGFLLRMDGKLSFYLESVWTECWALISILSGRGAEGFVLVPSGRNFSTCYRAVWMER